MNVSTSDDHIETESDDVDRLLEDHLDTPRELDDEVVDAVLEARRELTAWAAANGLDTDPFVTRLGTAMRDRDDLAFWSTIDLDLELPVPPNPLIRRIRTLSQFVTVLRNVAVFIPVALTWWAISVASGGFGEYVEVQALIGQEANFLQYWQSSNVPRIFRLQHVAELAAQIIVGIIAATLVTGWLNTFADSREDDGGVDRAALILDLRQALHGTRLATIETVESATTGTQTLEVTLQKLNVRLAEFDRRLSTEMIGAVEALNVGVNNLSRLTGQELPTLLQNTIRGLSEVGEQLNRTSVSVELGTRRIVEDLRLMSPTTRD